MKHELIIKMPYYKKISTNVVWKKTRYGMYLSPFVQKFRFDMCYLTKEMPKFGEQPVSVHIKIAPPTNRPFDLDNYAKSVLDALQYCKIIDDDKQVQQLYMEKMNKKKAGEIEIKVKCCDNDPTKSFVI